MVQGQPSHCRSLIRKQDKGYWDLKQNSTGEEKYENSRFLFVCFWITVGSVQKIDKNNLDLSSIKNNPEGPTDGVAYVFMCI